jgi:CobQ-like glutamine amidotransferase family enzyme
MASKTPADARTGERLKIAHLYPEAMDLYGDLGNVLTLVRRCEWRGIRVEVVDVPVGQSVDLSGTDIIVMGGGQDDAQSFVARDLVARGPAIRDLIDHGAAALAVCGGFQLFGRSYVTSSGRELPGIGVFDAHTVASSKRLVGNVVIEGRLQRWGATHAYAPIRIVGFENHSGVTHLDGSTRALGRVLIGAGNAGNGLEGAVYKNAIGTYLHGPLLPRNPKLADHLIVAGLAHRFGTVQPLSPLDDDLENEALRVALLRCRTGLGPSDRERRAG